jgi:hypothetical protein
MRPWPVSAWPVSAWPVSAWPVSAWPVSAWPVSQEPLFPGQMVPVLPALTLAPKRLELMKQGPDQMEPVSMAVSAQLMWTEEAAPDRVKWKRAEQESPLPVAPEPLPVAPEPLLVPESVVWQPRAAEFPPSRPALSRSRSGWVPGQQPVMRLAHRMAAGPAQAAAEPCDGPPQQPR